MSDLVRFSAVCHYRMNGIPTEIVFVRTSQSYIDVFYDGCDMDGIDVYDYGKEESFINTRADFLRYVREYMQDTDNIEDMIGNYGTNDECT